ncbi:hypothetical protein [Merismopedia glauca]|uniref:Uncharacterized protein n=1 Tax=Merismopedia glauca CCAP 1448/3 TaxID=1296344 RepID=A0A2T1BZ17_9CYAN|nr:hypothetical protein [Merismopedia glauca]PSB01184.1 hypothetical protein C7B64_19650 [Merismopedia glauca CCAP 1448/3]
MNKPLTPPNPEEDDLKTENLGNSVSDEFPPNPTEEPSIPNSQDPLLVNNRVDNVNRLNQLFRQLRVFQPLKPDKKEQEEEQELITLDENSKIEVQRLTNKIYVILTRALPSEGLKVSKNHHSHWDAFQVTWEWMQKKYDPDSSDANPYHRFNDKYWRFLKYIDLYRQDIKIKRVKNPLANDGDPNQPKTKTIYVYPVRLDKPLKDELGKDLNLLDILEIEGPPERSMIPDLINWFKSEPEILRQTLCFPRKKDSPTALDVALLLVEYYERGEGCTLQKLQARLEVSSQFYEFYRHKFISLVNEHFPQSRYYNGEQ